MTFQRKNGPPQSDGVEPNDPAPTKPAASGALRVPQSPRADARAGEGAAIRQRDALNTDQTSPGEVDGRRRASK